MMNTSVVNRSAAGSLQEWSKFLNILSSTKSSGKPLLKKAEIPERLLVHLECKLASPAFELG